MFNWSLFTQEALQFCFAIIFNYNRQIVMRDTSRMFPPLTWQISHIIVGCLSPIVSMCVLNQSHGHWLLSDALHFAISMSLRIKEENQILPSFKTLMDDDSIAANELALMASNIRKEVCGVLDFSLSFLTKYEN